MTPKLRIASSVASRLIFIGTLVMPVCQGDVLTVGTYDENITDENSAVAGIQNNSVDVSGTVDVGNQVALATFINSVLTAYDSSMGGVINFDNGMVTSGFGTSSITATYGTDQAKSITISSAAASSWSMGTSGNRTGISHPGNSLTGNQLGLTGGGAGSEDFVFNFSLTDKVVMAGGTVLSRSGSSDAGFIAQATFSDASTTSATFTSSGSSNGGNDTFAGFKAPNGLFITQLKFDNLNTSGSFRSVDDLAFVTSDVVVPEVSFLEVARNYANTMIAYGRDRYGSQQTPLFAETLDRITKNLLLTVPDMTGIRNHDRSPGGSNLFHMQQLPQLLYDLPRFTGDSSYASEADAALLYFFQNLQSPVTGLMAWGEHIGWDFNSEQKISSPASGGFPAGYRDDTHEFFELWELADRSFDLAPTALQTFAQGIWDHQVFSQQTGNFSRHTEYSVHNPEQGSEFPRHGGYFINLWAQAYDRSADSAQRSVRLQSIAKIAENFSNRRHPVTRALPVGSGFDDFNNDYRNRHWPVSSLEMCIDVAGASLLLPPAAASDLNTLAAELDNVFLQLPHLTGGLGFVTETPADNLSNIVDRSGSWITSYGETTDADIAVFCLNRYHQTNRLAFQTLAITAADRYLTSVPPGGITLYPGAFTGPINLMLEAHRLTGNLAYRTRAKFFGTMARDMFFTGTSGLPRASSQHDHYEAITGGDDLALVLLKLHEALTPPLAPTGLTAAPAATGGATLIWADLSKNEDGFAIERKQGAGAFIEIASALAADATTFSDSGLLPGATYSYRIRAFNVEGYSTYTNEISVTAYLPIEEWRLVYFGTPANGGDAADGIDPDFDGIVNLVEYALDLNPHQANVSPPPLLEFQGGFLKLVFPRHTGRTDLTYRVRASGDLLDWATIASSTGGMPFVPNGALTATETGSGVMKTVTVEDSNPLNSSSQRFLRLEITR